MAGIVSGKLRAGSRLFQNDSHLPAVAPAQKSQRRTAGLCLKIALREQENYLNSLSLLSTLLIERVDHAYCRVNLDRIPIHEKWLVRPLPHGVRRGLPKLFRP